ncbi:MAG: hypothetical protein M3132_13170, partial [Actinomycetia bacterium]|nr:hypothetical protein [Actinomycetes bacterium]
KRGVPIGVHTDAVGEATRKNRLVEAGDAEVEPWDCLTIVDYQKIITYERSLWLELYEKRYTKPGEENKKGGWQARTNWIDKLSKIRNRNFHSYSVKEEEFNFLGELTEWLIEGKVDNSLN